MANPPRAPVVAPLPNIAQIQGGLNAVNQAAFGNPQQPTSPLSILPTVPTGIPSFPASPTSSPSTPAGRGTAGGGGAGGGGMGGTGPLLGGGDQARGGNFLNTIRQRLGLQPTQNVSRGTPGGGPGSGTAAAKEAIDKLIGSNLAANPSAVQSLKMAGMFTGPMGLAMGLGNLAVGDPMGKLLGQSGFNVPGGQLSADAQQAVRDAFNNALAGISNPSPQQIDAALAKASAVLSVERAIMGMNAGGMSNMGAVQGTGPMGGGYAPGSSGYGGGKPGGFGGGDPGGRGATNPGGLGGGVGGGGFGGGGMGGQNRSM